MALNSFPINFVVILNYNGWADTIECIESVISSTFQNYQIIVIDNNSTDNSSEKIKAYFDGRIRPKIEDAFFRNQIRNRKGELPYILFDDIESTTLGSISNGSVLHYPIVFIQSKENLGFAGGNNLALEIVINNSNIPDDARVFLLNPDTFITNTALQTLNNLKGDNFICGCQIKLYDKPREEGFLGAYKIFKPFGIIRPVKNGNHLQQIDYIYGAALYTTKKTFIKNGLLPLDYFLYWEETDWCYRSRSKGIILTVEKNAIIFDKIGRSIGRGYLAHYYYIRNGFIFYKKYFGGYIITLFLYNILRFINKISKGEKENARAIIDGTKDYVKGRKGHKAVG